MKMKTILFLIIIFILYSCSDDKKCIEEFAQIGEIKIDTLNNNFELKILFGYGGCDRFKGVDEQQTDTTYTVNLIKCIENRYNPDISCPTVWIDDTLIRKIAIPKSEIFKFIINDSTIIWSKGEIK